MEWDRQSNLKQKKKVLRALSLRSQFGEVSGKKIKKKKSSFFGAFRAKLISRLYVPNLLHLIKKKNQYKSFMTDKIIVRLHNQFSSVVVGIYF